MIKELKNLIATEKQLQWVLVLGLLLQIITSINAVGFFHPDQHFQVIEFSSLQLGQPSSATQVWELAACIRPTLQVYVFSGYYLLCNSLHISDPYTQLTILRVLLGLVLLIVFDTISLYYFKQSKKNIRFWVIFLLNFSWMFPYTRTLFTSEMLSSLIFFGAAFLYYINKEKIKNALFVVIIGCLIGLSFYLRFQIAFAIIGFAFWIMIERKFLHIFPLLVGFIVALFFNTYLDYLFYHKWVFTPLNYFRENILEGKAASFGTSSFLDYVGLLVAVVATPPLSLLLIFSGFKYNLKHYKQPIFITVVFFIVGHCFIGHKEERFLFPIFNMLPILVGFGLESLLNYYDSTKMWMRSTLRGIYFFSVGLNSLLVLLFSVTPYCQTVAFSDKLHKYFGQKKATLYCPARTPFEIMSGTTMQFYKNGVPNITTIKTSKNDSIRQLTGKDILVAVTYNQIVEDKKMMDSLHYEPIFYSSSLLWGVNEFLASKKMNTINDIWALYRKN